MAPLLLKYLAGSLTRHLAQMSRFSLKPSPSWPSVSRSLWTLTTVPGRLPGALQPSPPPRAGASGLQGGTSSLLLGRCQHLACVQPSAAGFKTKSALKKRCKDCFFVRRRGRLCVICKTNPRHKQRQG